MSLIITIYTNEGIVMASDSRTTYKRASNMTGHYTDTAYKTFLCPNGCGISYCGNSSIGNQMLVGILNEFIFENIKANSSVTETAQKLKAHIEALDSKMKTSFHIAGYEKGNNGYEKKLYRILTGPTGYFKEKAFDDAGAFWDGEIDILSRLIKKVYICDNAIEIENLTITSANKTTKYDEVHALPSKDTYVIENNDILWNFMTLQEAIDFARFAINTTIEAMRFTNVSKTVGGPIDILVIKPNEAKWIARKELH